MTWPNGGGKELHPKDYYFVRFCDPDEDVSAGSEGVVVDHVVSDAGVEGCVVEVGPWERHGEPWVVVVVDAAKLERLERRVEQELLSDICIRALTRDAELLGLYDE